MTVRYDPIAPDVVATTDITWVHRAIGIGLVVVASVVGLSGAGWVGYTTFERWWRRRRRRRRPRRRDRATIDP